MINLTIKDDTKLTTKSQSGSTTGSSTSSSVSGSEIIDNKKSIITKSIQIQIKDDNKNNQNKMINIPTATTSNSVGKESIQIKQNEPTQQQQQHPVGKIQPAVIKDGNISTGNKSKTMSGISSSDISKSQH
ncbi:hypothetical protein BLA29_011178 [Euroglyphus maynei]|uniref:Uncharacterized protein n=1 Tax=Euroglyphus maynei TaxID=6958 RepID=A0A1Y3BI91_EURMA|nr:hypothetical protein BLA29_011178 [Euroglyphus maynei]